MTPDLWSVLHNARLMYTTYVQHAHNQQAYRQSPSRESRGISLCLSDPCNDFIDANLGVQAEREGRPEGSSGSSA